MIKLYHGTNQTIEHPDCKIGRDNLDFGKGFYMTLLRDQGVEWAKLVTFNHGGKPVLNVYDFDIDAALAEYKYIKFPAYDEAWMDFIVSSRNGDTPWLEYDFIEGGIANDRVIDTIRLYMYGDMDKSTALRRLSEHQPNHQLCILNQELCDKYLHFVESIEL